MPTIPPVDHPELGIIGDSVTAGMGAGEATQWPKHFASRYGIAVHDHAQMGAMVSSARKQADEVTPREIKGWLSTRLPASMRPARISIVPALPRTVTGKVDRVRIANGARISSK